MLLPRSTKVALAVLVQTLVIAVVESTVTSCHVVADKNTKALIDAMTGSATCTPANPSNCRVLYSTAAGRVTMELACGDCTTPTPGKTCVPCSTAANDCNTIAAVAKTAIDGFSQCPFYDGDKLNSGFDTSYTTIYCSGSTDEKKCQRIDYYDSTKEKTWIGCAANCNAAMSGKTKQDGSAAACIECAQAAADKDCLAVAAAATPTPSAAPSAKPSAAPSAKTASKPSDDAKKKTATRASGCWLLAAAALPTIIALLHR